MLLLRNTQQYISLKQNTIPYDQQKEKEQNDYVNHKKLNQKQKQNISEITIEETPKSFVLYDQIEQLRKRKSTVILENMKNDQNENNDINQNNIINLEKTEITDITNINNPIEIPPTDNISYIYFNDQTKQSNDEDKNEREEKTEIQEMLIEIKEIKRKQHIQ